MIDSREITFPKYMIYCVTVACIGSFSTGWTIGCPNVVGSITHDCPNGNAKVADSTLPDCIPMDTSLWGFSVASFCVGGLIGGISGGAIQQRFGRKKTIIYNTAGWIIGAVLIGVSVDVAMFVIGRIFCGLACGIGSLSIPTYIGETSTIRARGAMGTCNQLFITIGIVISSVVGLATNDVPLWRVNFAIVGIPAAVQAALMLGCVESPRWLVLRNRIDEARLTLQKLRGSNADIDSEFYEIVESQLGTERAQDILGEKAFQSPIPTTPEQHLAVTKDERLSMDAETMVSSQQGGADATTHENMSMIQLFRDPLIRRITLVVATHHAIQQLSGMNAVMYYSTSIFQTQFDPQMAVYLAIATNALNCLTTFPSVILMDKMGRRPLLLLAEAGTCIFSILLVIGYVYNVGGLLVVSVFVYVASFAIGLGPIPWLITSELTPVYASSSVGALATCINWSMNFVIGQVFPIIFSVIEGYSFCIFAIICFLAFLFTFFFLPETKNKSIEQIVRNFKSGKAARDMDDFERAPRSPSISSPPIVNEP
ncbi:major facilitator superfamily domain-containing protein [Dichotomocladium elegans]|nr:major facilitator superfamily domain-containing protein [Dichotomocladium elegans]